MNKLLALFYLILTTSLAINFINRQSDYGDYKVVNSLPGGNEKYIHGVSDFLFDQKELHTFELILPTKNLAKLDYDPTAEKYVEGTLKFNGETISPVGIRYKGSVGGFVGSVSGQDWTNPSGHKTAGKLSIKVKINWKGRKQSFYGLKKLQFHSQNLDPSQMHERLGYWLFREMGVVAPRSVHAKLIINGVYSGLYALTEQIDDQFVAYNYGDSIGNLYKEVWPLNYLGEAQDSNIYMAHLKTNKGVDADVGMIKGFADEIVKSTEEDLKGLIKKRMDLDKILAYVVVDRMIRNDDGVFHWYCGSHGCGNHNYYWYEEPLTQKLHLIPWDLDNAFDNIGYGKSPVTVVPKDWTIQSNDCAPFQFGYYYQKSAACDKLIGGWSGFQTEYDFIKTAFKNGPFAEHIVVAKLDEWSDQIRAATVEAQEVHWDALKTKKWKKALVNLKAELSHSVNNY